MEVIMKKYECRECGDVPCVVDVGPTTLTPIRCVIAHDRKPAWSKLVPDDVPESRKPKPGECAKWPDGCKGCAVSNEHEDSPCPDDLYPNPPDDVPEADEAVEIDDPCPDCGLDRTTCGHHWAKIPIEVPDAHAEATARKTDGVPDNCVIQVFAVDWRSLHARLDALEAIVGVNRA